MKETCWKDCSYTVCKPVKECHIEKRMVTTCKPVHETCWKECSYTVCKPVCETVMKTCKRTVCEPVCETKQVCKTVWEKQCVTETVPGKCYTKTVRDPDTCECDPCTGKMDPVKGCKRTIQCQEPDKCVTKVCKVPRTCVENVTVKDRHGQA